MIEIKTARAERLRTALARLLRSDYFTAQDGESDAVLQDANAVLRSRLTRRILQVVGGLIGLAGVGVSVAQGAVNPNLGFALIPLIGSFLTDDALRQLASPGLARLMLLSLRRRRTSLAQGVLDRCLDTLQDPGDLNPEDLAQLRNMLGQARSSEARIKIIRILILMRDSRLVDRLDEVYAGISLDDKRLTHEEANTLVLARAALTELRKPTIKPKEPRG